MGEAAPEGRARRRLRQRRYHRVPSRHGRQLLLHGDEHARAGRASGFRQITGVDIIKQQLIVASGDPITCADLAPMSPRACAIEFRINAEDPAHDFRPCPGTITRFDMPGGPGVRVDTHLRAGGRDPAHPDSLMAKLIVG